MRRALFIALSATALGLLGLLAWGVARQGDAAAMRPAPDFTLTTFEGRSIALSDLRGSPVVLNFWASWCIPCREEAPALAEAWRLYRERGVVFVGINLWDRESDARAFIEEFAITYPNGPDRQGRIAATYRVTGVPETFFITRDGKVMRRWLGPITIRELRRLIQELT